MPRVRAGLALVAFLLAVLAIGAVGGVPTTRTSGVQVLGSLEKPPLDLGFPIGWYDGLALRADLPDEAADGMDTVLPYYSNSNDIGPYLDAANASGLRVIFAIPGGLVGAVATQQIADLVAARDAHPALAGWYLADEPSIAPDAVSPADAATLYSAIKARSTKPVAMAFAPGEDAASYGDSFDVLMADNYPCDAGTAEYERLANWTSWLDAESSLGRGAGAFLPILQAFGGTDDAPVLGHRLPTRGEERYMAYSAIADGADGLFFWAHYRADPQWIRDVLRPIVARVRIMRSAIANGARTGLVASTSDPIRLSVFTDPATSRSYVIAVNRSSSRVRATLRFRRWLALKTSATDLDRNTSIPILRGRMTQAFKRFEVKVYRL